MDKQTVPYIEDIAILLGIDDDSVNEWTKTHDEFSATIKRAKILQRKFLKQQGLSNKVNVSMAIFLLKANHRLIESRWTPEYEENDPVRYTSGPILVVSKIPENEIEHKKDML